MPIPFSEMSPEEQARAIDASIRPPPAHVAEAKQILAKIDAGTATDEDRKRLDRIRVWSPPGWMDADVCVLCGRPMAWSAQHRPGCRLA